MKKLLLLGSAILTGIGVINAQDQRLSTGKRIYPLIKNFSTEAAFPENQTSRSGLISAPGPVHLLNPKRNSSLRSTYRVVGTSCYDLQSNNSVGRSIINHGDGTLSFAWTVDNGCTSAFANRGSGYNYWNGSSLLYPGGANARIETFRTGFTQIALLGNGSEVMMAHKGLPYGFITLKNSAKGIGTWTIADTHASDTVGGEMSLWARIAAGGSDGNSIHLISNYFTTPVINGMTAPMVYSRSTDAGVIWDQKSVMLPFYDTTRYTSGNAEDYAIDADLNTVAIVHAGLGEDVVLWKSTDNGTTFTRTFVDSFAFAPNIDTKGVAGDMDTTSDGTSTVALAPNGTAHVAWATARVEPGGYHPTDAELVYWNDAAKKKVVIPVTIADVDATMNGGNSTGTYNVGTGSAKAHNPAAASPPNSRYGAKAFLSQPSIAVENNSVFIIFSLITDGDSTGDGRSFRDIWVVASADGGVTFGTIQNVTCSAQEEEYYTSLAKRVDDFLHILYQADIEPGNSFYNMQAVGSGEIRYAVIDKAKVLAGTASCSASSGVNELSTSVFNIGANYPNPVSGVTNFDVRMKENAAITFNLYNDVGQQVYGITKKLSMGNHTLSVDASAFASGLYLYTIRSGDAVASGKMTVAGK